MKKNEGDEDGMIESVSSDGKHKMKVKRTTAYDINAPKSTSVPEASGVKTSDKKEDKKDDDKDEDPKDKKDEEMKEEGKEEKKDDKKDDAK